MPKVSSLQTILLTVAILVAGALRAEYRLRPDANTLWCEDGRNLQTCPKIFGTGFHTQEINVAPNPSGGFFLEQRQVGKPSTGRFVSVSPDYPYLVFQISSLGRKQGYFAMILPQLGSASFFLQENLQKGYYVSNAYQNKTLKPDQTRAFMKMNVYGAKIGFDYIKMVKRPDYWIQVDSPAFTTRKSCLPGDSLTFSVFLKETAEDVSLNFYDVSVIPVAINGRHKLQLEPVGEDCRHWQATIVFKKISKPCAPLMKAVILGSSQAPNALWGKNYVRFINQ